MTRRIGRFFLLLSLPLLFCSSPFAPRSSGEVDLKLSEGENGYMAKFFRGDELGDTFLNDIDRLMMGKLGSASGGLISPDRHEAHLKPGEKVYAVVKVTKDVRVERLRAILETRVTQNPRGLSTAAALHQNYFKVNYIDFSAGDGSTSFENGVMLNRSTQDRPYMIVTPAGDKLFYFAYQACGGLPLTQGVPTMLGPFRRRRNAPEGRYPASRGTGDSDLHYVQIHGRTGYNRGGAEERLYLLRRYQGLADGRPRP